MIGNVFENYCWNGDIGNWFDFLSSKRAFLFSIFDKRKNLTIIKIDPGFFDF